MNFVDTAPYVKIKVIAGKLLAKISFLMIFRFSLSGNHPYFIVC